MTTTALICTSVIIALGIYDLCVVTFFKPKPKTWPCNIPDAEQQNVNLSISRWLQSLEKYPFIILVFGYVAGHVWGFMACPECPVCPESQAERVEPQAASINQPGLEEK